VADLAKIRVLLQVLLERTWFRKRTPRPTTMLDKIELAALAVILLVVEVALVSGVCPR